MSEQSYQKIIYDRFIKPFGRNKNVRIGVEIEMCIVNVNNKCVNSALVAPLMDYLLTRGFTPYKTDGSGVIYGVINDARDAVLFESSHNILEFALQHAASLPEMAARFKKYHRLISAWLRPRGLALRGVGLVPGYKLAEHKFIDTPRYNILETCRRKYAAHKNCHSDAGMFLKPAGVQTHLSFPLNALAGNINFFNDLSWVAAKLFSNSGVLPSAVKNKLPAKSICYRDFLYGKSYFGLNKNNVGVCDKKFKNIDDIIDFISEQTLFFVKKDGRYRIIKPTPLKKIPADIDSLKTYCTVQVTRYGTLEFRGECAQPPAQSFAPAAFFLGALLSKNKIKKLLAAYALPPSQKRFDVVTLQQEKWISGAEFSKLILDILTLCKTALIKRGFGEEAYLKPLWRRAKTLKSPAEETEK